MLRCKDPSVKNVEMAMESFGDELGAAGGDSRHVKWCELEGGDILGVAPLPGCNRG